MSYWRFKGCPKCHGDVYVEREAHNWSACCLQCGSRQYLSLAGRENQPKTESKQKVAVK